MDSGRCGCTSRDIEQWGGGRVSLVARSAGIGGRIRATRTHHARQFSTSVNLPHERAEVWTSGQIVGAFRSGSMPGKGELCYSSTACIASSNRRMRAQRARLIHGQSHIERQMQGIRIGPVALLSIQDEPFIEIGQQIVAGSPFEHTLFSGYSNGNFGYLPVRSAFAEGGYEVSVSLYSPDAAEMVVEEGIRMLQDLAADSQAAKPAGTPA